MSATTLAVRPAPIGRVGADPIDRLVVVCDDLWPTGGAGAVARECIVQAVARGIRVSALVGDRESAEGLPAEVDVAPVFGGALSASRTGLNSALAGVFHPGVRRRAANWIDAHDTPRTVYHLHNWHKSLSPSVFDALRRVERRLVMTAHDYFLTCPNGAFHNFRIHRECDLAPMSRSCLTENCDKRRYLHKAWRVVRHGMRASLFPLARMNSVVVAPHEGVTPYLVRGGVRPDRIKVIPNPATPWSARRVMAERQQQLLFVGRLEQDKGAHLVADAAHRCGLPLTLVGDGPLAAPLAQAHPQHRFLGRRTRAEIAEIAARTRLLVVAPEWRETFGLVTFEGVMSGVPTMLPRNALIADELRRLDAAQAFNPDNVDDLSSSLMRLYNDVGRIAELSANGFALRGRLAPGPDAWGQSLVRLYVRTIDEAAPLEGAHRSCRS